MLKQVIGEFEEYLKTALKLKFKHINEMASDGFESRHVVVQEEQEVGDVVFSLSLVKLD